MFGFGRKAVISVILVVALAYYVSLPKPVREGKVVETKSGAIRGLITTSRDGREVYSWFGIPYAKPPVGDLRFASPEPVEKWKGIRDGTQFGSFCVQNNFAFKSFVTGNEDCLFLNIHVPKKLHDSKKLLPVLFYVHGGAYLVGSGIMGGPDYFMDEDVLLVSINYRLDILGFLSTGDKVIRGNMGLKDQVQALRWVQENVASFGGDPNRVTIFGHSAGGASVHQLLLSPMTKGLFHKAISHSGAASNTWGYKSPAKALENTKRVGQDLGCPIDNSQELAKCLRNASVTDLMGAVWLDMRDGPLFKPLKFGDPVVPTIEAVDDKDAFLTQHPLEVAAQGKANRVPWMVGHSRDEGLMSISGTVANSLFDFEDNREECVKSVFNIDSSEKALQIYDFYLPPSKRSTFTPEQRKDAYVKLLGDAFFAFDIRESIFYQRQFSSVYPYFFNKEDSPDISEVFTSIFSGDGEITSILKSVAYAMKVVVSQLVFGMEPPRSYNGVNHAVDASLLFGMYPIIYIPSTSMHYEFSKSYVKLVVDFASSKDESTLTFRGVQFPRASKSGPLKMLEITNDVPRVIEEPFRERMEFLHSLKIRNEGAK